VHYGTTVTVDELLPMLLEDKAFYNHSGGGVTLSGGECLCQADFCAELLKQLKENGIHTAVDTCGFVPRQVFEQVLPYTDLFLYDIKAIDEDVHIRCTGQSNSLILDNFLFLKEQKAAIEVRYPYVPDRNDDQADAIAAFIGETPIRVLSYHNHAGSKYAALNMENTLPTQLPTPQEIAVAEEKMSVLCR
jgi:pyruvate formate lyase activating enzyme